MPHKPNKHKPKVKQLPFISNSTLKWTDLVEEEEEPEIESDEDQNSTKSDVSNHSYTPSSVDLQDSNNTESEADTDQSVINLKANSQNTPYHHQINTTSPTINQSMTTNTTTTTTTKTTYSTSTTTSANTSIIPTTKYPPTQVETPIFNIQLKDHTDINERTQVLEFLLPYKHKAEVMNNPSNHQLIIIPDSQQSYKEIKQHLGKGKHTCNIAYQPYTATLRYTLPTITIKPANTTELKQTMDTLSPYHNKVTNKQEMSTNTINIIPHNTDTHIEICELLINSNIKYTMHYPPTEENKEKEPEQIKQNQTSQSNTTQTKNNNPIVKAEKIQSTTQKDIPNIIIHTEETKKAIEKLNTIKPMPQINFQPTTKELICKTHTEQSHKEVCELLQQNNINYYTYSPQNNKPKKYVLKYIPSDISATEVQTDLIKLGIECTSVRRLHRKINQQTQPTNIMIIEIPTEQTTLTQQINKIGNLSVKCYPYISRYIPQCYRCQRFWHASQMCKMPHRCVRCGKSHPNMKCQADKCNCANCGEEHPANYKQCNAYLIELAKTTPPTTPTRETPTTKTQINITQHENNKSNNKANYTEEKDETNQGKNQTQNTKHPVEYKTETITHLYNPDKKSKPNYTNQTNTYQEIQDNHAQITTKQTEADNQTPNIPLPPEEEKHTKTIEQISQTQSCYNHHENYLITAIQILQQLQSLDLNKIKEQINQLRNILHTPIHPTDHSFTIHNTIIQSSPQYSRTTSE